MAPADSVTARKEKLCCPYSVAAEVPPAVLLERRPRQALHALSAEPALVTPSPHGSPSLATRLTACAICQTFLCLPPTAFGGTTWSSAGPTLRKAERLAPVIRLTGPAAAELHSPLRSWLQCRRW